MDPNKEPVKKYFNKLIDDLRRDNPSMQFSTFPEFDYPVDGYIYGSLGYLLTKYNKFVCETVGTILTNTVQLKELDNEKAFELYTELCKFSQEKDDGITEMYFSDEPDKRKEVSCKKGCSWCCHQSVQVNGLEGKHLWSILPRNGISQEQKRVAIELAIEKKLNQKEYAKRLGLSKSRCAFLDERGECSIYEKRPLVCRYYTVYEHPDKCKPLTVPDTMITGLPVFMAILEAVMFELYGVGVLQVPNHIDHIKRRNL